MLRVRRRTEFTPLNRRKGSRRNWVVAKVLVVRARAPGRDHIYPPFHSQNITDSHTQPHIFLLAYAFECINTKYIYIFLSTVPVLSCYIWPASIVCNINTSIERARACICSHTQQNIYINIFRQAHSSSFTYACAYMMFAYTKCKMSFRLLKYIAYLHIGTAPPGTTFEGPNENVCVVFFTEHRRTHSPASSVAIHQRPTLHSTPKRASRSVLSLTLTVTLFPKGWHIW